LDIGAREIAFAAANLVGKNALDILDLSMHSDVRFTVVKAVSELRRRVAAVNATVPAERRRSLPSDLIWITQSRSNGLKRPVPLRVSVLHKRPSDFLYILPEALGVFFSLRFCLWNA
jgi:hypothetical protein